ncbi:MAG: hypothetical protein Q8933_04030 [Bacteroidota bacterium]|nr:hypothetical protein [Bacteroidota bacterium]MDP4191280.1 hypothetical protein [Bacteroidota bacterium]MDP4194151.1 hypothetical protein [Bacteroidota bacterium]
MKFVFEKLLETKDNVVCVDGLFEAKLQLSHWRDNDTPYELKADTTTEMAFKLIESSQKEKHLKGIDTVSNNHFDADGLISAYVLVHPEMATEYKSQLINVARTGDFAEFTTEDAIKANVVIESLMDIENGPVRGELKGKSYPVMMQIIYERGFSLLPELIDNIDKYERYWKKDFELYERSEQSFENQESVFSNYSDCKLSVIESPYTLHTVSKFSHAEFDIVLSVVKTQSGNHYQLEYKPITWFETLRKSKVERKPFDEIAKRLQEIEKNNEGEWKILGNDPIEEWDYRLVFADEKFVSQPSSLAIYELESLFFELL